MSTALPQRIAHATIATMIPHQGTMCLLDEALAWSAARIHCVATNQGDPRHPLRTRSGLLAPVAIEYAAQAMALHGALVAPPEQGARPGYLASVRQVEMHVKRLDDIAGTLHVEAERLAGDAQLISYSFALSDDNRRVLVRGRATVMLNSPIP